MGIKVENNNYIQNIQEKSNKTIEKSEMSSNIYINIFVIF